jgi:hypothetical protein
MYKTTNVTFVHFDDQFIRSFGDVSQLNVVLPTSHQEKPGSVTEQSV